MNFTAKEVKQLQDKVKEIRASWAAACEEAGVATDTKFVIFSNASDLAKRHNDLMGEYQDLRKRIVRNSLSRERHSTTKDLGLKRVKGAWTLAWQNIATEYSRPWKRR